MQKQGNIDIVAYAGVYIEKSDRKVITYNKLTEPYIAILINY